MKSKIENIELFGFKHAIKGLRKSWNSVDKMDSKFLENEAIILGKKDLELMAKLVGESGSHRKFLRCIHIQFDALFPLYWWKQFDQYKIGTTTLSTSTMHTIHKRELTRDDFEDTISDIRIKEVYDNFLKQCIEQLNFTRHFYIEGNMKDNWKMLIQLLPSAFLQDRTIDTNLEVIYRIYEDRAKHKLKEWEYFIETLQENEYVRRLM